MPSELRIVWFARNQDEELLQKNIARIESIIDPAELIEYSFP
jgi:hypothetical protein